MFGSLGTPSNTTQQGTSLFGTSLFGTTKGPNNGPNNGQKRPNNGQKGTNNGQKGTNNGQKNNGQNQEPQSNFNSNEGVFSIPIIKEFSNLNTKNIEIAEQEGMIGCNIC